MKTKPIRVDSDVYAELQRLAKQWGMEFKSPNEVLRRALALSPPPSKDDDDNGEVAGESEDDTYIP